ncbi:hypothetical protein T11_6074 [Trichinella zimbabwensis]|uniref:Uncharacterized protein n=1 Tax=Trichinella zimbabwensis TaxID=268475 RepID=A0A0V1GZQ2_9BILA|nr:hypothetical protein T11_5230 [Trichinella zimbabwensis]KRZ01127.1 hypothetical protein T11_10005 [Trichinella zimbabwensis]KRZ03725.1 hypothetical protein T11_6074 [Trichinella zimbabwensis]
MVELVVLVVNASPWFVFAPCSVGLSHRLLLLQDRALECCQVRPHLPVGLHQLIPFKHSRGCEHSFCQK